MRTLWRTTASLLRKYPILWLPVAIARLISFNLHQLDSTIRSKLTHALMPWVMHTYAHSVLSGNIVIDSSEPDALRKLAVLTAPIQYGTRFLGDFLFACALIATAAILHSLATTGRATLREATAPIYLTSYRILTFCLKVFGLGLISTWIISFLSPFMWSFIDRNGPEKLLHLPLYSRMALGRSTFLFSFFDQLWILPITLSVVYVIAPIEVHLLQPPDLPPTQNQSKQARLAEMTAAVAISALGLVAFAAQQGAFELVFRTGPHLYLVRAMSSLLIAIPYVPLYIAFYLIANPDSPLAATPQFPDATPSPPQSPPPSTAA
jgi:hypothetical protein